MSGPRKPRRKSDGSYEISFSCPCCGSSKAEVNSISNLYHCWSCSSGGIAGGVVPQGTGNFFLSAKDGASSIAPPTGSAHEDLQLTDDFPIFALQECVRRKQEPQWLIQRYGVRWSYTYGRLWFPAGDGGVLRSVLSWEKPKTVCYTGPSNEKRLIGEHLLRSGVSVTGLPDQDDAVPKAQSGVQPPVVMRPGAQAGDGFDSQRPRLVLCEGDWKCVSIPIPWTGLGLQGTQLTEVQRNKILLSNPVSIIVMLDGGWTNAAQKIVESLLPLKASRVDLPGSYGPDDVPRSQLVKLLLEVERVRT